MKQLLILLISFSTLIACSQNSSRTSMNGSDANAMLTAANQFISTLDKEQKQKVFYSLSDSERYNWHFIPKDSRIGITLNELKPNQREAALALLRTGLSEQGYDKAIAITQLENVLRMVENRPPNDNYRNPGKYYFSFFGTPSANGVWGWRFEGHHMSFNFSSENNMIVAGTPGFMGTNPAIVLSGPEKGKQVLKEEADNGFALLNSLSADQLKKALIDTTAPGDIITYVSRKAMIENPRGILYSELNADQQKQLLKLVDIYIHRYTKLFADDMWKEIKDAGLENLHFAWAGGREQKIGVGHYYRITGPTIIIEFDNTQNNANHIHTVVRDLKRDFGGDELLEHYMKDHKTANN